MAIPQLSTGCIDRMVQTSDPSEAVPADQTVTQILSIKKIPASNPASGDRYRIILSDGIHFAQAMLATQLKHLAEQEILQRNSIVRVTQYASNLVQNRRILILLGLEPIGEPLTERIGTPQAWDGAGGSSGAAANGSKNGAAPAPVKTEPAASNASKNSNPYQYGNSGGTKPLNRGPSIRNGAPIYPIEGLSPYQNKWTIKARVTSKSDIKHWSNQRGEGKLFSVNLLDESGEIKATGFNDAVDRFYPMLQENKVFYISKARVNIAKKQFSNLSNEYEIAFENNTEIEECLDAADVPEVKYEFVKVDQLDGVEPNQTCDLIGVVENIGDSGEIISKASQKPITKRELTMVDDTGFSVKMTLWGKTAETFDATLDKPVIAFKGVKVSDFGGRSLSMFSSSTMMINPDIPEAHGLRGWYDNEGSGAASNFKTFSNAGLGGAGAGASAGPAGSNKAERRTILQAKEDGLGMSGDKPDYFNIRATVIYIKQDTLYYPACPSANCNKKVTQEDTNSWRCEKCDATFPAPEYRYILAANVSDHSDSMWLSGFNEIGELLIGMSATELERIKEASMSEYTATLHRATNKMFMFNVRAKQDTFNDTTRVRYTVTKATPIDWSASANELADAIKAQL